MPSLAILPSTDVFEDHFGRGLGLSRSDYASRYRNDWIFRYVEVLVGLGWSVDIVVPSLGVRKVETLQHRLAPCRVRYVPTGRLLRVFPSRLKRGSLIRSSYSGWSTSKATMELLGEYDVVYVQEYSSARFAKVVASRPVGVGVVGAHHGGGITADSARRINRVSATGVELTALTRAEGLALTGALVAEWAAKVHVVPNWVDVSVYRPLGSDVARRGVIWAGRLNNRHKRLDILLRALAVIDPGLWAPLTVVGDGPDKASLKALAVELGIDNLVVWPGFIADQERIAELFARAAVFVNPSAYEGLPLTVLEAQACGLPVLASNIPGHQESVDTEAGGLFESTV
jgi:glycosyltransferase involved in cell wall biosynthesis